MTIPNRRDASNAYIACLARLSEMLTNSRCLSREHNPVLLFLRERENSRELVRHAVEQYSFLPATIVEYLTLGVQSVSCWSAAASELERNRAEEMGSRTLNKSHYDILRERLLTELQIDLTRSNPTAPTLSFLQTLRSNLKNSTPALGAGVVYALESSAVMELIVVAELLNEFSRAANRPDVCDLPAIIAGNRHGDSNDNFDPAHLTLSDFIAIHVADFEIGHEAHLAEAFEGYLLETSAVTEFETSFKLVLDAMEIWWINISNELKSKVQAEISRQTCNPALVLA